jgi:hypothetical protein
MDLVLMLGVCAVHIRISAAAIAACHHAALGTHVDDPGVCTGDDTQSRRDRRLWLVVMDKKPLLLLLWKYYEQLT